MNRNITDLHPLMRPHVEDMIRRVEAAGLPFKLFEGYRSPERQLKLFGQSPKVTRARPWQSSHQYGLAVDFVGYINGKWSWADDLNWTELKKCGEAAGLVAPIGWDRPHFEHPAFRQIVRAF